MKKITEEKQKKRKKEKTAIERHRMIKRNR